MDQLVNGRYQLSQCHDGPLPSNLQFDLPVFFLKKNNGTGGVLLGFFIQQDGFYPPTSLIYLLIGEMDISGNSP